MLEAQAAEVSRSMIAETINTVAVRVRFLVICIGAGMWAFPVSVAASVVAAPHIALTVGLGVP